VKRLMLLAVVLVAVLAALAPAAALAQSNDEGRTIFEKRCARCHQDDGSGIPNKYPPLAGNPDATDLAYVTQVVRDGLEGKEIMGVSYSRRMPSFGKRLSDAELQAVAAYVVELAGSAPAPTTTTTLPAGVASAAAGEDLFRGTVRLSNGGPACIACHRAGAYDRLGGPGMGPDLTGIVDQYGEGPFIAAITDPPWDPMVAIFADHPLTAREANDLTAFLETTAGAPAGGTSVDLLVVIGIAGLLVLVLFTALVVRGPQRTYVQKLRSAR